MKRGLIAAVAYGILGAYSFSVSAVTEPAWDSLTDQEKQPTLARVDMLLANPDSTPEQLHTSWLDKRLADGWTVGSPFDAQKKQHPLCVPYSDLPQEEKIKDYLLYAVVQSLKDLPDAEEAALEAVTTYQKQLASVAQEKGAGAKQDPAMASAIAVKYIGRRPDWRDSLYNTGLYFTSGQTRQLPAAIARKLLKHADLFTEGELDEGVVITDATTSTDDTGKLLDEAAKQLQEKTRQQEQIQDVIDRLGQMDKDQLADYAYVNYQQKVPKTLSVENMKERVIQLVNQFGIVP